MRKLLLFFFVVLNLTSIAQPMFFNSAATGGANSIPFNSGATMTWRRAQFGISANSIGTVQAGNMITKVWFLPSSTANVTYPSFTIRLKQGSPSTGMVGTAGGQFEQNMTVVYQGTNFNMVTTANTWYGITLQTPFLYDPSQPLIVDFEHNHTNAAGPTVNQPGVQTLGNGRQWGDGGGATIAGTGTQLFDFGIDVVPAPPCTSAPPANTLTPAMSTVCAGYPIPSLMMTNTYSLSGLTYQWFASTTSSLGPYTAVTGATLSGSALPTVTVNTWYSLVATCASANQSTTLAPVSVSVMPTTTNTVPYFEGFEGISKPNELPNCSWISSSTGVCQTYTSSNTNNRVPRTGNKFASFYYSPAGTNYYYTNGVLLKAGVTYSAGLWFTTEYLGSTNWADMSILVGPSQSTTGLVSVASTGGPAVSNIYKSLSGTFSVPTTGLYYFAIKGQCSTASGAGYMTWDDFSVTIPCEEGSPNRPNLSITVASGSICAGDALSLSGNGADTYTWNVGGNTSQNIVEYPLFNTTYQLVGTSALTGCTDTVYQSIAVIPTPGVFALASKNTICAGENVNLTALANNVTYFWSAGSNPTSNMITVSPTGSLVYSVTVTNAFGCSNTATVSVAVNNLPTLSVSAQYTNMCVGEMQALTGFGASTYQWLNSSSQLMYSGSPLNISPNTTTTYTLIGTDINGCTNKVTYVQNVDACTGIKEVASSLDGYNVYPNPTSGEFTLMSDNKMVKLIEVVDLTGRVLANIKPSSHTAKLNISNVALGVYYLKVHTENKVEVMKIVKQ
ncbi:MAG: T9SS type A sorting domain-containing protein [Bacteroidia bacterium]|nr:T9SS type A sorting domain-containing protein [Bacteroidia bacterium]